MHTVLRNTYIINDVEGNSFLDYGDMEALREFILEEEDKKYNRERFTFEDKLYYIYDSGKSTAQIVDAEVGDGITLHKDNKYIDHYSVPLYRAFGAWLKTQKKHSEAKAEGDSRMTISQEAVEAAAKILYESPWGGPLLPWEEATEVNKLVYRQRATACLAEALPSIEEALRKQIAVEVRQAGRRTSCCLTFEPDNCDGCHTSDEVAALAAKIAEGFRS